MTMLDEDPDPFSRWCQEHDRNVEDPAAFAEWVQESTGWDGQQFSLSEDERHWIKRADEIIGWLRQFAITQREEPLLAALRCLNGLKDCPSLRID